MEKNNLSSPKNNAIQSINCAIEVTQIPVEACRSLSPQKASRIPTTSIVRQHASLSEEQVDIQTTLNVIAQNDGPLQTYLYLAYGSNLAAEVFLVRRAIKPISQINVVVPEISLTFDLAGIPYTEPCFGNCRYRNESEMLATNGGTTDYHKDRWKKGLVGVVYEVTAKDYAHIIATEGGGSGYQDVLVECYPLDTDPTKEVPQIPQSSSFRAHTLFAPPSRGRPDHSYAQPSARYLKLITDGAEEHDLPQEYLGFLRGIRTYHMTTGKQRMGQWVFGLLWLPLLAFIFGGARIFLKKDGTYPKWFKRFTTAVFNVIWASYDRFFEPLFGDGERTIGDGGNGEGEKHEHYDEEKVPLLGI